MQSFGEAEIMIDSLIVGRARVQHLSALDSLGPRLGARIGIDLDPVNRSLYDGQPPPNPYSLTDLRGELRLGEKGPAIGTLEWVGAHHEVRAQPYPSESQIQLACDLDLWTLERLERQRAGGDVPLWIELWPRLEHAGGYLPGSIRGFPVRLPRGEWLRFLEDVGYGTYELLEIRIPAERDEVAHRAIDGIRAAQRSFWSGDHERALTECRKTVEALESLAPSGTLESLLSVPFHSKRAKSYAGIASRLKEITSAAVHDYGRDAAFARSEVRFLLRATAALVSLVLDIAPDATTPDDRESDRGDSS